MLNLFYFFFFKQKTAYEMRISDWSSDVCSSDLRKRDIGVLHKSLQRHGYDAVQLHGDMSQPARMETLQRFKNGDARLVVCSDVAARGLDIKGLSHVFNFDVPSHAEDYVHRIGRRSEEHTSELQSLMRISYAVFCLKNKN